MTFTAETLVVGGEYDVRVRDREGHTVARYPGVYIGSLNAETQPRLTKPRCDACHGLFDRSGGVAHAFRDVFRHWTGVYCPRCMSRDVSHTRLQYGASALMARDFDYDCKDFTMSEMWPLARLLYDNLRWQDVAPRLCEELVRFLNTTEPNGYDAVAGPEYLEALTANARP